MDDRYMPIAGGYQIRLRADECYQGQTPLLEGVDAPGPAHLVQGLLAKSVRLAPEDPIGRIASNPRRHRRPLYPPADKTLVWSDEERAGLDNFNFRPLVLAYHEPRFLFDYHSAGGLLGHLQIGLAAPGTGGKWLHEWSDIIVRYVNGRCEYEATDPAFPGTTVALTAGPLANAVGLIVKVEVAGAPEGASFVWAYGGASAYFTNYNFGAPEFHFAPEHCRKDHYAIEERTFELARQLDDGDGVVSGDVAWMFPVDMLKNWTARVRGASSWDAEMGFGAPEAFDKTPGDLLAATAWVAGTQRGQKGDCVVVERVSLSDNHAQGHIVVGMGGRIEEDLAHPKDAFQAAVDRCDEIAGRVAIDTPDPHLNAAATMLAFANESLWGGQTYVHGGWSWRIGYAGWRICYGPTCYGWTDRVRQSIRNHCRFSRIEDGPDAGGLSSTIESKGFYYNMNEVFFDMVRHYFEYTNDLALMEEIFPALEGILERQERRLRPTDEPLYENSLNTWISDSHWYIEGLCTQSSAYTLRAYTFMADVANRLGRDGTPYRDHAEAIRAALQRELWQQRAGVFAEYRDARGNTLLHPEPELPTLYHSAEFGAVDSVQLDQMLDWADTHLEQKRTPGGGIQYWSSNWYPNHGRSYTHSTHEMAYAEELNFAETQFLAGRTEKGYALLRGTLNGIFNGPTPGGLACHAFTDGTQRGNDEFADAESMWARAVMEGLFGIKVDRPNDCVWLTPNLPADWPGASVRTPHFAYTLTREAGEVRIAWEAPDATTVRLRLPVRAARINRVEVDERVTKGEQAAGCGFTWLETQSNRATKGSFRVAFEEDSLSIPDRLAVMRDETIEIALPGFAIGGWSDPQGLVTDVRIDAGVLRATISGTPGSGMFFVQAPQDACPRMIPIWLDIRANEPVASERWQASAETGRNLDAWSLVDLAGLYNASVSEVPGLLSEHAIPPEAPHSLTGFDYWRDHLTARLKPPCDDAWRAKIDADGVAWTADGIPIRSAKEGPNIVAVALHNKYFPASATIPVGQAGNTLYLMISGMTHPVQSHVVNLRVALTYEDGDQVTHDLVNPFDIGDCWSTWCGTYYDTPANGFENIGGRHGPAGTCEIAPDDLPVAVDTIAHLLRFDLRADAVLDTIGVEAIANDAVFGVMGTSIRKGK